MSASKKTTFELCQDATVEGLVANSADVSASTTFGESGDVFNHELWRPVFFILWSLQASKNSLLGLITTFLLRGKSLKDMRKNQVVTFNIKLPAVTDKERVGFNHVLGDGVVFPLKINFPTESSKVPANALTMERFKCLMRIFVVPEMLQVKKYPSTAESIGLGNMIRSLQDYEENVTADMKDTDLSEDQRMWKTMINLAENLKISEWMRSRAAAAGTVSSKEIYNRDEENFPGCVAWAGLMALMTDASNKIRAPNMPKDIAARFERSSFYPDFKRKMAAKNILIPQSPVYTSWLSIMAKATSKYLKTASGLTADESRLLDSLVMEAQGAVASAVEISLPAEGPKLSSVGGKDLSDQVNQIALEEAEKERKIMQSLSPRK